MNLNIIKIPVCLWLCMIFSVLLSGCVRVDHEPHAGEYGQTLVNSIQLTSEQIAAINRSEMPRIQDAFKRPNIAIDFPTSQENPYRFVIVVKGHALQQGKVNMRWLGGIRPSESAQYHPQVFGDEDDHRYKSNEPVLLVISSDPFSIAKENFNVHYTALAELTERENLVVDSIQLQVWQGKGSQYSWVRYAGFFVVLMMALLPIYRILNR
ncbi:hypothetical protein P255_01164 [Acinetobacter brisouii CIP 110357]|uniref:Uncharacterized protein n=1 Tax=Acinetobacter brisouii CIP 110357 TaxID=1341683 RepID=V2USW4_9GAMM|nr:hypothetical protein [Acinetobacter brisouii]ENV48283.1 hypothetical protein F954_01351 [Acinetobacter brisouii ANC 4119]ESK51735.1 hypothetical protein P255_01164 [Acinetobacter brisouii CIP 110357]